MSSIAIAARAAALGFLFAAAAPAYAQTDHGTHGGGNEPAGQAQAGSASQAYMDAMTDMNQEMEGMEMSGKAGVDFALMMIPHHQSAIDMARAYLESGENDPELTELSNEIIAAQEREIAFLRDWLSRNGQ